MTFLRLGIALGVIGLSAGCAQKPQTPTVHLADAERAFRQERYQDAIGRLTVYLEQVPKGDEAVRARYVRGMAQAMMGRREAAFADLEWAAREAEDPEIAWQPDAMLGVMHFEDEDWAAAERAFQRAVSRMPDVPPKDALLFRVGLCRERQGLWSAAQTPYRNISERFPGGAYAEASERRLQLRSDHFAVQCGVYQQRENAVRMVDDLQARGLEARVSQQMRADQTYYVVLAGRYASYHEAVQGLARVRGYVPSAVLWP